MVQRLVGVEYVNIICSRFVVWAVSLKKKIIKQKNIPGLYIKQEAKFVIFVAGDNFGKRRRLQTNMKEFQVNDSWFQIKTKEGSTTNITSEYS